MSLKYALLAGLALEPRSGFDLAQWFADTASYYWSATHSSIYPALAALERERLIAHTIVPSDRGPARKVYSLTLLGHDALLAWLDTPTEPPVIRDEGALKALCYGLLTSDQARAHVEAARERHSENLARYKELLRGLDGASEPKDATVAHLGMVLTLRRGIDIEKGYITWCDEAIEAITTRVELARRAEERYRKKRDKDKRGKKKHKEK